MGPVGPDGQTGCYLRAVPKRRSAEDVTIMTSANESVVSIKRPWWGRIRLSLRMWIAVVGVVGVIVGTAVSAGVDHSAERREFEAGWEVRQE